MSGSLVTFTAGSLDQSYQLDCWLVATKNTTPYTRSQLSGDSILTSARSSDLRDTEQKNQVCGFCVPVIAEVDSDICVVCWSSSVSLLHWYSHSRIKGKARKPGRSARWTETALSWRECLARRSARLKCSGWNEFYKGSPAIITFELCKLNKPSSC